MQRSTPLRTSHTSTSDLLTWSEIPPPHSAAVSAHRSRQPSDRIGEVLGGGQLTEEEAQSLTKRKPCSGYKMKEITGSGIFSANTDNAASEANSPDSKNRTSIRVYQQALNQISFSTEESISPKKPTSLPEVAKQRELSGTLQSGPDTENKRHISSAKSKELSGNDIFGPPPKVVPHKIAAARTLESKESKDMGESVPRNVPTSVNVSNPAGGQSKVLFVEETVKKTSKKKIYGQKFAELTGNNIFKGDAPPGSAEKPLSNAKLKEMTGSDIFADGKAENREYLRNAKLKEMTGSDIFADGKAENREYLRGARRPPGGGSSIALV